ncbi:MAG: hypothetical protein E5V72_24520 [Mesorhizobium sp.]|nr:MAG: hypothetical protein E5V72_24520 [Mesorhizobium sp.]
MLLADKGYDANALRNAVTERRAWANIPPKANRKDRSAQRLPLPGAQPRRALLQQGQAVPPDRNPIRQTGGKLPRCPQTRLSPHLATR